MGKNKKGFNWRARKVVNTVIDDSKTKQIKLDLNNFENANYDNCNALALPSQKRKTKIKEKKVTTTKLLSKSKRKKLEKVLERKKKKENRATLLEALSQVQINDDELKQLTSISSIRTKGLKKYQQELNKLENLSSTPPKEIKINSLAGSFKRRALEDDENNKRKRIDDPNIVGFDSETDSSDDESQNSVTNEDNSEENETDMKDVTCTEQENLVSYEEVNIDVPKTENFPIDKNETKKTEVKMEVKPAVFVNVNRTPEIQAARLKLPILAEEQVIMETINDNQIVIIAGETGSGKTTQVPQFLYEAGYACEKMIGVTEPRRVAAISMSKRVAEEMNLTCDVVSYLIRFEGNVTPQTKIKFMTDGVLLKEIENDFLLTKYSVIILDEAHERSVYTDILIGLLSRIVPLRHKRNNPLKLIVMSATLRIEDFTENKRLFKVTPPVINVESRQFPVTVHFSKRTNENYLSEAFKKAVKIHNQLPVGGILIFVTGQREVNWLVNKLRRTFSMKSIRKKTETISDVANDNSDRDSEEEEFGLKKVLRKKRSKEVKLPEINLDDYTLPETNEDPMESGNDSEFSSDEDEECAIANKTTQPLWVLPLYSLLPSHKQARVFEPPPEDTRLCVVATNVAETSLTIPNIKYVIDSGRVKVRLYDKITGVSTYQITWASKAAASQRTGRAGRTGPGHCYRLYSSAVFNDCFKEFAVPEIQRKPVDDLYLQMKCMNIDKVINFPFPSAPDLLQLRTAERRLIQLEALKEQGNGKTSVVTPLGKAISKFPVLPRFGKMLALSHQQNLLPYTICMVAALSVPEVLLETPIFKSDDCSIKEIRQKWFQTRRTWAGVGNSLLLGDPMVLLRAVGAAEYANSEGQLEKFCNDNGLRHKAVIEIRKLRVQLTNEIKINMPELDLIVDPQMKPPTDVQAKLLRQILLNGMPDQIAKKMDLTEVKEGADKAKFKYAYQCPELEEPVFLHSNSILRKTLPEWVVYQEIYETNNKMYMRGVTAIEPEWLPVYATKLCNLGEPLLDPEPKYDCNSGKMYCTVSGTVGRQSWQLPNVEIPFPESYAKYKWFAKCILEGKVFKKLEKYTKSLLNTPATMIKTWANLQPRTDLLLKTLMSRKAGSKSQIVEIWETEPDYLLDAYKKWLPESAHNEVTLMWPPKD